MSFSSKKIAHVLKLAAKNATDASTKQKQAENENTVLRLQIAKNEKLARARAIATMLVVGDDTRKEIDERAEKIAAQDLDVIEKAIELGNSDAVLKLGEAMHASSVDQRNDGEKALYDLLATLL